ncbi:glycosyltransferase [Gemmatimonas groenlandica]|uniref:Glycosyltransferase n=1 Tax=Gemmatimonas groenlandica TaxID=2732249 RepID=A0A6M4ISA4_9BACT|nr:glycosyltransferase [Gemmatimonas groenlandica]QJR37764.1 glycosyltransferase [Gemmatimonas groenlandica]
MAASDRHSTSERGQMVSSPVARSSAPLVAVVIPCHNEAKSIGTVVADFRRELPDALIVVVDNSSHDGTASIAAAAGARVVRETRLGKGHALIRGFNEARAADSVVMVDGDGTYSARHVGAMLQARADGADMVIGTRLEESENGAFPRAHGFGNRLFIAIVRLLFGLRTNDLFSGYRVLSRQLLDALPLIAHGFEIESELSLQSLVNGFRIVEIPTPYGARQAGTVSKLRTFHDGYRILLTLLAFFRDYRPLTFFGIVSLSFLALGLVAGSFPVIEYFETGLVQRLPLAVLAVGLVLLSAVSAIGGLVLSSVRRRSDELAVIVSRMKYLQRES